MTHEGPTDPSPIEEEEISRGETGVRILLTLLFVLVTRAAEAVIGVIVLFELAYTLVTRERPSPTVRRFALRVVHYVIEVARYLVYVDDDPPFPFRELPPEPELDEERA